MDRPPSLAPGASAATTKTPLVARIAMGTPSSRKACPDQLAGADYGLVRPDVIACNYHCVIVSRSRVDRAQRPATPASDSDVEFPRFGGQIPLSDWPAAQCSPQMVSITHMTEEGRFRVVFEAHYGAVTRFLRTRGHDGTEADDLVAGTFEVAWRRMDQVPEGREALPWLIGVARNLSRNARRKSRREASFVDELTSVTVPFTELPIEDRAASAEVMGALAQLKPVDRDLILLVAWDELTPQEAGQVVGLRPVTARSRLHRARRRLGELLAESAGPAFDPPPPASSTSTSPQEDRRGR